MKRASARQNVTLIGMPGSGKTTIGRYLAKHWGWTFFDTDHFIESGEGKTLEQIIETIGFVSFVNLEGEYIKKVQGQQQIISTGGSVIYVDAAMQHLRTISTIVYLETPLPTLEERVGDLKVRGVVIAPDQSLASLLEQRHPLYVKYADVINVCDGDEPELSSQEVIKQVEHRWNT
ncbi:MAG: shikimate kinase [Planctomycetia bacterium]|nr:shikimate kinase [Planctomycetia bacterium]